MTITSLKTIFLCLFLGIITQKAMSQTGVSLQNDTLSVIETPAKFPKGGEAMFEFIRNNLTYPTGNATIEGSVYLGICIEADGSLTDIKVRKSLRKDYDEEAKRVFSIMPKWTPAVEFGTKRRVKSYATIPVKFKCE